VEPREVLLAKLAGAMAAPMVQFAGLLEALPRNLAYGLKALIDQKAEKDQNGVPETAVADAPAADEAAADEAPAAPEPRPEPEAAADEAPAADETSAAEAADETPAADAADETPVAEAADETQES
jgi:large subunit ribosomal protein L10